MGPASQRFLALFFTLLAATACVVPSSVHCRPSARAKSRALRLVPPGHYQRQLATQLQDLAVNDTVIISQVTCGYLEFTENWMHYANKLGVSNYLLIAADELSYQHLLSRAPRHVVSKSAFTGQPIPSGGSDIVHLGNPLFVTLGCSRPLFLRTILSLGFAALYMDLDAIPLKDPLRYVPRLYEYVGVDDSRDNSRPERDSDDICTCFIYVRPAPRAFRLLEEWDRLCAPEDKNDQLNFNEALRSPALKDLQFHILPRQLFPNGWAARYAPESCDFWREPAWVHANWLLGTADNKRDEKRAMLYELGLWEEPRVRLPVCDAPTRNPNSEQRRHVL